MAATLSGPNAGNGPSAGFSGTLRGFIASIADKTPKGIPVPSMDFNNPDTVKKVKDFALPVLLALGAFYCASSGKLIATVVGMALFGAIQADAKETKGQIKTALQTYAPFNGAELGLASLFISSEKSHPEEATATKDRANLAILIGSIAFPTLVGAVTIGYKFAEMLWTNAPAAEKQE